MTPRILEVRHSARSDPSQVMCGYRRDWWVLEVKRVLEDLAIETVRPLLRAQAATSEEWRERVLVAGGVGNAGRSGYCSEVVSVGGDEGGSRGIVADEQVEEGRGNDRALRDTGLLGGRGIGGLLYWHLADLPLR